MLIWYKLLVNETRHPNIVHFLGYITDVGNGFGLVSEYFSNGDVMSYIRKTPSQSVDRLSLVSTHFIAMRLTLTTDLW